MFSTLLQIIAATAGISLQVDVRHDWIYSGSEVRDLAVNVSGPKSAAVTVDFNLVSDLSLMHSRDTVLSLSRTVHTGSDGKAVAHFPFNGIAPGFYQVNLSAEDYSHPSFNIGIDSELIQSPADRQDDFDSFWEETLKELAGIPANVKLTEDPEASNELRTSYIVEATSLDGAKMGGYLCIPVKEGKYPVYIDYMGYGADCYKYNPSANPEAIEFLVSVRDQGIFRADNSRWIDRGLESKDTFYYRGAFCDAVRAVDIVCGLEKADTGRIFARGESQGGALTFAAAALDGRIRAAAPAVPFLCDYEDYSRIVEWPMWEVFATADEMGLSREELFKTLSYFDIKNLADRIKCPVFMAFGLQDPTCPPHTNFSAYNLLRCDKQFYCASVCGHAMWEVKEWAEIRQDWFKQF
ncbi:MAG: acetylxylan esterase [Bacteroidales bacterium]|nr:acetylxylan esterase [Bacteroidales bacterium]